MDQESITRKQGEVNAVGLTSHEIGKEKRKKELIKRLNHIQKLAKEKNYAEIKRLVQESYV